VHACGCQVDTKVSCSGVVMVAVLLAVDFLNNIGSFFFFFICCCDDVWGIVVVVVPCVMCVVLPTASHMLELCVGCNWNESQ